MNPHFLDLHGSFSTAGDNAGFSFMYAHTYLNRGSIVGARQLLAKHIFAATSLAHDTMAILVDRFRATCHQCDGHCSQ